MGQKIIYLLVLVCVFIIVKNQVLGIDFGTEFWKAAIISPGKNLQIVENSRSERKTLNSIAFDEGLVRFFQSQSLTRRIKKPQSAHFYLNRLIYSLDSQPLPFYKFQNHTYFITHNGQVMILEQVVAMILKNLKYHASRQAGTDIKDCVFTIPPNWGPKARRCLINSAHLANLSTLGLIHQNSAALINFAMSRSDSEPVNMVVFNLGSSNLQISVMKLWGFFDEKKNKTFESLSALSHVVKSDVGGLAIDQHIGSYLADEFQKIHKVDPRSRQRSFIKLLHKSSEAKQILSANKQTKVYIESLINGIDLQIPLKRQLIDNFNIFQDFPIFIHQALQKAGLSKQDISFVELIGGSTRVPKVANVVKEYFGQVQVGSHINGDEAMALGCAVRAGNLSIGSIRAKELHFYDDNEFEVKAVVSSIEGGVISESLVFKKEDGDGSKKSLTVSKTDEELKITFYGEDEIIKEYVTTNLTDGNLKLKDEVICEQPYVIMELLSSSISTVEIREIYLLVKVNLTFTKEIVQYVEEPIIGLDSEDNENSSASGQKHNTTRQKHNTTIKTIKKNVSSVETVIKTYPIELQEIFVRYPKFNKEQIKQKQKVLLLFEENEKQIKEKAKIKNELQSSLYSIRAQLNEQNADALVKFSSPTELQALIKVVTQQIQWLDQNQFKASKEQLQLHFKKVTKTYDIINNRSLEYHRRQKTFNHTINFMLLTYNKTQQLNKTHAWLVDRIQLHLQKINNTIEQLNNKILQQYKRPFNQNPIIYNYQLIKRGEDLRAEYYLLKMTPRPKIEKPKADDSEGQNRPTQAKQPTQTQQPTQAKQSTQTKQTKQPTQTKQTESNIPPTQDTSQSQKLQHQEQQDL